MKNVLAGLWSRRGLNAATFALAVVAVAVAMIGPLYAQSSVEHLLDSRMAGRLPATLGLTATEPAMPRVTVSEASALPTGGPEEYDAPEPAALLDRAKAQITDDEVAAYWQEPHAWLLDEGGSFSRGGLVFDTALYWRDGMCGLAQVRGRCPAAAGEALMDTTMAGTLGLGAGDTFDLEFTERWLEKGRGDRAATTVERSRVVSRTFTIVGTYQVTDPEDPAWFQPARFQGEGSLRPPAGPPTASVTPTAPALLVDPSTMTSQTFVAGLDRPIDIGAVDVATMQEAAAALSAYRAATITDENAADFADVDLTSLVDQVEGEQTLLSRVTLAAAVPLVVLALLLLHNLVSAAADVRRPQVALAKLRGFSPGKVMRFALAEPFLTVLAAIPVAVLVAYLGARVLTRTWLDAATPVIVGPLAVGAAAVVTLTALATAGSAVVGVVREPLASSLASATRKPTTTWASLVARTAVVMLAVAALVQVWSSRGSDSTTVLELLAPLFIGLAVAVGGVFLLGLVARLWVARTRRRGGTASYLSARRLLRRRDMGRLIVPLLLSVSVTTFAVSAWQTADDWRVSTAKSGVGAPTTYLTTADPGRLMQVTHEVDPSGEHLAAAVVDTAAEGAGRSVLVDTPRFAEVAAWDDSWSSSTPRELERRLVPPDTGRDPLTFAGRSLSLDLADVSLKATLHEPVELWVRYTRGDTGAQSLVRLGPVPDEAGSVRGFVSGCAVPCRIEQIFLSGSGLSITDAVGQFTITGASDFVSGERMDWPLTDAGAWRAARDFPAGSADPPLILDASDRGLRVRVRMGGQPGGPPGQGVSGIARIAPTDVVAVPPVLVTADTPVEALSEPVAEPVAGRDAGDGTDVVVGSSLLGTDTPMRRVGEVRALPVVGDVGAVSDLSAALREYGQFADSVSGTQLWAAEGTPAPMIEQVRAAGIELTGKRTVAAELEELRGDAFSLGWKVFLLVGVLTVLLAILGILAAAVVSTRWRAYEVAALRVVGVRQRALVRSALLEYVAMLGCAVLLGAASAVLALRVVLPSINIGEVGEYDPFVDYAVRWPVVGGVAATVFVAVLLLAAVISVRTARLGKPSSLRQAEQA